MADTGTGMHHCRLFKHKEVAVGSHGKLPSRLGTKSDLFFQNRKNPRDTDTDKNEMMSSDKFSKGCKIVLDLSVKPG